MWIMHSYLHCHSGPLCERDVCEINYCTVVFSLRVALVHEASQVRAAALRAVRYLLKEEKDVRILNKLRYPCLISRYVIYTYALRLFLCCYDEIAASATVIIYCSFCCKLGMFCAPLDWTAECFNCNP